MRKLLIVMLVLALLLPASLVQADKLNELKVAPKKGAADTINLVNQLDDVQTILYYGAHPDDENNSLLVYLNRKMGVDPIYATLNWGEGGDNSIGSELYGALGALRSQELLSSRAFDGSTQMYLGGYDFGYSISMKESLLGDKQTNAEGIYIVDILGYNFAKLLRIVRPDVLFSSHSAPTWDHGQHMAVGFLNEYGMDLAADPGYKIYDDQGNELAPFQVKKLFTYPARSWQLGNTKLDQITTAGLTSQNDLTKPDMKLDLGEYDPTLGMSFAEWGVIGRNMHKCQKMVSAPVKGESISNFILKKAAPEAKIDEAFSGSVFGGIEIATVADLGKVFGEHEAVKTLTENIKAFQEGFTVQAMTAGGEYLAKAAAALDELKPLAEAMADASAKADALGYIGRVANHINRVVKAIYALDVDISVSDKDVVPGQTITVTSTLWARSSSADAVAMPKEALQDGKPTALVLPEGWQVNATKTEDKLSAGVVVGRTFVYEVTVPADYAAYTGPYNSPYDEAYSNPNYPNGAILHDKQRVENTADTQDPSKLTSQMIKDQNAFEDLGFGITTALSDPYAHPPILGAFTATLDGRSYLIKTEPELRIVPKLSVQVSNKANMLKFTGEEIKTKINVVVSNNMTDAAEGIMLTAKAEDSASGIQVSQVLINVAPGSVLAAELEVTVPAAYVDSSVNLVVEAHYKEEAFTEGYQVINYSHINTVNFYQKAVQKLSVIKYGLPSDDIRIGFLKSSYDDYIFDYIKGMYADPAKADSNLKAISVADITKSGEQLAAQFDTIIVGKTALPDQSPIAADLKASFANLLDFANKGGNLVLHYQNYRPDDLMSWAPVPFPMASANINKEDSEVFVGEAAAKTDFYRGLDLKLEGEKSSAAIWDGWIQQRCEWTPGLAVADAVQSMEALGYTVLFKGQDPEGTMRPAILYKEMENGGHYTYSAVVWERQLQGLVPGAYLLYANLISMGYKAK
ncbi:MAG: hypothetical protein AB9880_11520 [Christensenellales bacterium]